MYEPRTYRYWVKAKDLMPFNVVVKETDLYIFASTNLKRKAQKLVVKYRDTLESYIERHPTFLTSLEPLSMDDNAPHIVKEMLLAAARAGVGPMASVAGAIAEFVGNELLALSPEIIVENGGDIYLKSQTKRIIGIYAGESPLTGKIGLEIEGEDTPLGICTSSGTVGHSLSYGKADAVVVVSKSATLADAAATATGNLITQPGDISTGIEFARGIEGLAGVLIIQGKDMGVWGKVKICPLSVPDEET
ncbi:MAG: UPF0280 family protein [Dehalococcoidales bacterium]|nr:UPF0280 family protein [Dehalococcoidales bacterium]